MLGSIGAFKVGITTTDAEFVQTVTKCEFYINSKIYGKKGAYYLNILCTFVL